MAISDPALAFRLVLFTIGTIASAKCLTLAFRKLNQHILRSHYRKCQPLLTQLYKDVNAFEVSLQHREKEKIKSDEFIYGEIIYSTFAELLSIVQPRPGEIFYDLGCGGGKAVFTTALLYPDISVRGVEVLPPLYKLCLDRTKKLKNLMHSNKYFKNRPLPTEFIQSNLIDYDFSDGNIVFLNATCFEEDNWSKIKEKLNELPAGARIIVSSKSINHDNFELIHASQHLMSWGMNTVHIYRK